jgi:hypothetical protein
MKSPLFELQKAIFGRLAVVSCPVHDAVPQGSMFPYVTLGEDTAIDWSSKTTNGQETTVTLHVWSRYNGYAEAKQIGGEVIELMTVSPLIMTGFEADSARLDMQEYIVDSDGITRHGILKFRLFIAEV